MDKNDWDKNNWHKYWGEKWATNDIGFHEAEGNPYLKKFVDELRHHTQNRVFVPLCGKTKDIDFLLAQGFDVVAAELDESAIEQLFADLDTTPEISSGPGYKQYSSPGLTVFVGDIFDLTADILGKVTAVYDRAALVALPDDVRKKYASHMANITGSAPQLLLTFCYQQAAMQGPPFSVDGKEVQSLYEAMYSISMIARSTVPGKLKGQVEAESLVFKLS